MQHLPIHPSLLHPLTGEPLRALWVRPDGRICWPILGGDGTEADANDDARSEDDNGDEAAEDSDDDDEGDRPLGPKGEKALQAEKDKRRAAQSELRKFKELGLTPEQIKALQRPDGKSEADNGEMVDADKIRAEARAEAARDALHGRVEDKIEAKARAFADPEDAVAVLLRSHEIDDFLDDDQIDVEAITDALAELGEKKPHLLAQGGKRFQGDADGGSRKEKPTRAKSLGEAINRHYEKS